MADIVPAIFFGHGNPMNAPLNNSNTEAWRCIGEQTPMPRGILAISAHWCLPVLPARVLWKKQCRRHTM